MISRFFRHIKEGFLGVKRHGAMSISSASAVTITLIIISIFAIFTANLEAMTHTIEGSVKISVMIDYDFSSQEQIDAIGVAITNIEGIDQVKFSSKDEELQFYIDSFDNEKEKAVFEPYKAENPMHDAYYVTVKDGSDLSMIADKIRLIEGVYDINYGGESAVMLISALASVRNGGFIIVAALSFLAIFLIQNTIKLTIFARSNEIAIMRNVGAKNGFIRAPFVVEGIIIGILGSIIPIAFTMGGYLYLYDYLGGVLLSNIFVLVPPTPLVFYISLLLLALGVMVGFLGSFLSVSKYLRWKR